MAARATSPPAGRFIRPTAWREWSFLLIPLIYVLAALILGFEADDIGRHAPSISPLSPDSAIAILAALGTGMMAVTAIVYSLALLGLQFGSTAYSPRMEQVIGGDPLLRHGLGVFVGTFVYSLLAIRTVDLQGSPGLNTSVVWLAFAWLLASVVFVALLSRGVRTLTISSILPRLESRGAAAIARLFPPRAAARVEDGGGDPAVPGELARLPVKREIHHHGPPLYVIGLALPELVDVARQADGVLVIPHAVGDPVVAGDRLALLLGSGLSASPERIRRAIWLESHRTTDNDPGFTLRLLVDIAIRALSPAINDPTTAVACLDQIEGLLRQLGRADLDVGRVRDDTGALRLVYSTPRWDELVELALAEIQWNGQDSIQVQRRITALLCDLVHLVLPERRAVVQEWSRRHRQFMQSIPGHGVGPGGRLAYDRQGLGHTAWTDSLLVGAVVDHPGEAEAPGAPH